MQKNTKDLFIPIELKHQVAEKVYSIKNKRDFAKLSIKYYYVLHVIYYHLIYFNDEYTDKGIAISTETLKSLFGNKRDGSEIIHNLQDWDILILKKQYSEGKARRFKLNPAYENLKVSLLHIHKSEASFISKIVTRNNKADTNNDLTKAQLNIFQKYVTLSIECIEWLRKRYPSLVGALRNYNPKKAIDIPNDIEFLQEDIILISFLTKDFFVDRPNINNRIFSNLTSLKREYRPFILLDGKPLIGTDLVNSQILFSVPVIKAQLLKMDKREYKWLPVDFYKYKAKAQQGTVYNIIADRSGKEDLIQTDRKKFKQTFFGEVFFCKPKTRETPISNAFGQEFPNIYKSINQIKTENGYEQFAVKCQISESHIMLDKVYRNLIKKRIKALSLHDSIYVSTEDDVAILQDLIEKELYEEHRLKVKTTNEKVDATSFPSYTIAEKSDEMLEWFESNTGLKVSNHSVHLSDCTIYPASGKVKYNNSNKTYTYSKENFKKLVKSKINEIHKTE